MAEEDEQTAVTAIRPCECVYVCVSARCDVSFLPNSQREVHGDTDNRLRRADSGYKSPRLNLWMIGIRGARGRMCAPCSDHGRHHTSSSDDTVVLKQSERQRERERGVMIPNANRFHNHKARTHCTQLLRFHCVFLFYFFFSWTQIPDICFYIYIYMYISSADCTTQFSLCLMSTDSSSEEKQCAELCRCGCLTTANRLKMQHAKCQQTGGLYTQLYVSALRNSHDLPIVFRNTQNHKMLQHICAMGPTMWTMHRDTVPSLSGFANMILLFHKLTYRANCVLLHVHCLRLWFWTDAEWITWVPLRRCQMSDTWSHLHGWYVVLYWQ